MAWMLGLPTLDSADGAIDALFPRWGFWLFPGNHTKSDSSGHPFPFCAGFYATLSHWVARLHHAEAREVHCNAEFLHSPSSSSCLSPLSPRRHCHSPQRAKLPTAWLQQPSIREVTLTGTALPAAKSQTRRHTVCGRTRRYLTNTVTTRSNPFSMTRTES